MSGQNVTRFASGGVCNWLGIGMESLTLAMLRHRFVEGFLGELL